jgi:hypothetical protein
MVLALAGSAAASPGDLPDRIQHDDDSPLTLIDPAAAPACALKAGLCVTAGSRTTIAVASAPVASAGPATSATKAAPVVPRFSRAASAGSPEAAENPTENQPWTLDLSAVLKKPAWAGNALFLFFDLDDPEALPNRQFTALYQAPVKAAPKVAAKVTLTPDEGFRAGHTYRVRIVQLINGKEIVLAEGDVSLL